MIDEYDSFDKDKIKKGDEREGEKLIVCLTNSRHLLLTFQGDSVFFVTLFKNIATTFLFFFNRFETNEETSVIDGFTIIRLIALSSIINRRSIRFFLLALSRAICWR